MIYALSFGIRPGQCAIWVRRGGPELLARPTLYGDWHGTENVIAYIEGYADCFPKRPEHKLWVVSPFISKKDPDKFPQRVIIRRTWTQVGPRNDLLSWTEGYELFCQHVRMML